MRTKNQMMWVVRGALLALTTLILIGVVTSAAAQSDDRVRAKFEDAQKLLNDERYERAAREFRDVFENYDDSKYAADAMYWYAFALYRLGGTSNLRRASDALEVHMDRYGKTGSRDDASALYYRVLGELAKTGDEQAARKLEEAKGEFGEIGSDMETKLMAMEALINMSPERAMPILRSVMDNKSKESAELREKAVFLVSQHESQESIDMLIDAAKNDPSVAVREKAVFWLSQVDSEQAIDFLEDIVNNSDDAAIREKAVFAISQHDSDRSAEILRRLALSPEADQNVREKAIFWLGQKGGKENVDLLMSLYDQLEDGELKEKVVFSVSQSGGPAVASWLTGIALNKKETMEARKHALFWASQEGYFDVDTLAGLYRKEPEVEFREQVIFALSQKSERKALDVMMDLAREEKNTALRKKLIFWIGQSDDPRATDFLVDIINQ